MEKSENNSTANSFSSTFSSPLRSDEKVQSRYLSPHTASCHDLCKHGMKYDCEAEEKHLNFKNLLKKNATRDAYATSKVEAEFPDNPRVPKPQTLPPTKKKAQGREKVEFKDSRPLPNKLNVIKLENLVPAASDNDIINKKTKSYIKNSKVIPQKVQPSIEEPAKTKQKIPLHPKRADVPAKPAIALKTKAPLIRSLSKRKSSRSLNIARRNKEKELSRSLETSEIDEEKGQLKQELLQNLIAQREQKNKTVKGMAASRTGERKISKSTPDSISSKSSPKNLGSMKRTSRAIDSVPSVQLKKLGSIKRNSTTHDNASSFQQIKLKSIKRTSKHSEGVSSSQLIELKSIKKEATPNENVSSFLLRKLRSITRSLTPDEYDSTSKPRKLKSIKRDSSVKANTESNSNPDNSQCPISAASEEKKKQQRTASAHSEDNNTSVPFKLKFRRGKVINLRSDSIGPRRLWLNIGKLAGNNTIANGLLKNRSIRNKKREKASLDSEAQSVVLKHHSFREKKDAESLFNHVIEETANKLVETRKSKVKALVGAFETVIDLSSRK